MLTDALEVALGRLAYLSSRRHAVRAQQVETSAAAEAAFAGVYGAGDRADLPTPREAAEWRRRVERAEAAAAEADEAYLQASERVVAAWRVGRGAAPQPEVRP